MRSCCFSFFFVVVSGCSCEAPPDEQPPENDAGSVRLADDGTITLSALDAPLRAFQVDVSVDGGDATALTPIADHDIVEAGLSEPKSRFTVVVGDTRRVPIGNGALARLALDDGATATLTRAFGVDADGKKRSLTVVVE